ncbi:MAG: hypothetical protein HZA93_05895 [Verrucomicrobia bacterium]|nr:hypothetical protein [Verrucomicrobiota bacterium]
MSAPDSTRPAAATEADRLARLEERLARIEAQLGIVADAVPPAVEGAAGPMVAAVEAGPAAHVRTEDEIEFEVGQSWFALAGIVVLTIGAGFLISLPFARLPVAVPALAGFAVAGLLLGVTRWWRDAIAPVANPLCGAAMVLLGFATLRLFFPEARQVVSIDSLAARGLLLLVVAGNFFLALRRRSPWLTALALLTGCVAVVAAGAAWFALPLLAGLALAVVAAGRRHEWPELAVVAAPMAFVTYLLWALGNPLRGGAGHFSTEPVIAPLVLPLLVAVFAVAAWLRPREEAEGPRESVFALLNCGLGYGVFLLHTVVARREAVAGMHALAFVIFVGLAAGFWMWRQSRVATFFYAMTGYAALTVAIFKASAVPAVFVWLSVQSVVVVATAIWFRSRFIVVANFLIYVAIVLGYIVVTKHETGISLGFGVVALVSARILNWQKERLELKTGLMRNAYLVGAFLVFPYALYHLVPVKYVTLAWVGLAVGYYALNVLIENQKYRWMGHATLLLTTCYLVVIGTRSFEPVYRVLSFLVLGTVLLAVSVVLARMRRRRESGAPSSTSMAR